MLGANSIQFGAANYFAAIWRKVPNLTMAPANGSIILYIPALEPQQVKSDKRLRRKFGEALSELCFDFQLP